MPTVAIDARDARGPQLRGWGRYTLELVRALRRRAEVELLELDDGGPGPEIAWEQLMLPRILHHRHADLLHAPNCFLPPRRPCPGVVTIHDLAFEEYPEDFARKTALKYRTLAPRAARSAARVIVPSTFTRDDVVKRYGIDEGKVRVIGEAPVLPIGTSTPPDGPYLLAVGDLRAKKNFARLATAFAHLHSDGLPHRLIVAGLDAGEGPAIRAAGAGAPLELPGYVSDA